MFKDRRDAGQQLSLALKEKLGSEIKNAIVIALPRGGLLIGDEIARELELDLDIVVPRKIGAPGHEEYAIGALTEDGEPIFNEAEKERFAASEIEKTINAEREEAKRRLKLYRGRKRLLNLRSKTVILVDDGIATGLTMIAAIRSCQAKKAEKIIVAVPVAAPDSVKKIKGDVAEVFTLERPLFFMAVGQFYEDFPQTTDEEVIEIMKKYQ